MHAVQAYLEQVWGDAAARFTLVAPLAGPTLHSHPSCTSSLNSQLQLLVSSFSIRTRTNTDKR
jgi:hypothetical protein